MSLNALEAILEQDRGGIWFLPGHKEPGALRKAAQQAGFAFFHVDGKTIARKEQLLNHMATALRFPKEFGHNWDALEDHLTDLEWVDANGYLIYYDHIDGLLAAHPDQFETLVEILRDAVASWKEDGTAMVVLLSGAKAPKGVAKLSAKEEEED
jgi:RNAse (barnase) inhibitor barstar